MDVARLMSPLWSVSEGTLDSEEPLLGQQESSEDTWALVRDRRRRAALRQDLRWNTMLSGLHCPQGYGYGEPGTPWRDVRWSSENKQS